MSCPECFSGHENPGKPDGRVETVHGRNTYIAEPNKPGPINGIIVIISDAFGWEFVNSRILADHYASAGNFRVYVPDFMDGSAAPLWMIGTMSSIMKGSAISKPYHIFWAMYGFIPFIIRNRFSASYPKITSYMEALRKNEGATLPIGAAGFCWGGKHIMNLADGIKASNGKPLVDACFTAHPSNLAIPAEIEKVVKPVSIANGDKDMVLNMKGVEKVKKIWAGKPDLATEVKIYEGAGHGFAVRADTHIDDAVKQAGDAEKQAVEWFQKQFAKVSYR